MNKIIVLDTSVILYDRNAIHNLKDNDIYLPLIVLEEIDKKKQAPGVLGENARYINRLLDELRQEGSLTKGVPFEDGKLFIIKEYCKQTMAVLEENTNDHKIIATCSLLRQHYPESEVRLITKDINLRVKADALGLKAGDYYTDYEDVDEKRTGWKQLDVDVSVINKLFKDHSMKTEANWKLLENEFVVLKAGQASALAMNFNGELKLLWSPDEIKKESGVLPKNKEQLFALTAMINENIPLISLTGMPGSGKTFLALMAGLSEINNGNYERIIYTRPIQTVDKSMGFLPGTLEEKFDPFLAPLADNFQNAFGNMDYFHMMRDKGQIDIAPISYIRGRSLKNCFIIVDESQNATKHELKTIITRVAEGSKVVLIGDTKQIDTQYLDERSNGLTIIADRFKNSKLAAHVHFTKGYRSPLASEADELID